MTTEAPSTSDGLITIDDFENTPFTKYPSQESEYERLEETPGALAGIIIACIFVFAGFLLFLNWLRLRHENAQDLLAMRSSKVK
jgi:hypothetical protein